MCKVLNRFIKKEINRLQIFVPPRFGKSELVSRRLPALLHGLFPNDELMAATYNGELAADMTTDVQRIMDQSEYQELFPNSKITPPGKLSPYARNSCEHELLPIKKADGIKTYLKGKYRAQGIGGSFSGRGAKWIILDDPIKNRDDADSKTYRENVWKFYSSTLRTRLEGDGGILLVMTRWHPDDLAGRLLKLAQSDPEADQWTVIRFPAIKEDNTDPNDPRKIGEALWPSKFDEKWLLAAQKAGARDWAALYQQRPTVEGGNIIKSDWFKTYTVLPQRFDEVIQSWDFAVEGKTTSDFNVGTVWGRLGIEKYLLHMERGQWSFKKSCDKVIEVSNRFPLAHRKYIEKKANGAAIIDTLAWHIVGFVPIEPRGDKVARLNSVAPEFESGHVWIPSPQIAPWVFDFINELCEFPNSKNDDICFIAGTKIATPFGDKNIEELKIGDKILSPFGIAIVQNNIQRIIDSVITNCRLTGTPNHPVISNGKTIRLDSISQAMVIKLSWKSLIRWTLLKQLNLSELSTEGWEVRNVIISLSQIQTWEGLKQKVFTSLFGNIITIQKCLKVIMFIIKIIIPLIMIQIIWSVYQLSNIVKRFQENIAKAKNYWSIWLELDHLLKYGILLKKVKNGMQNTLKWFLKIRKKLSLFVNVVEYSFNQYGLQLSFVPIIATSSMTINSKKNQKKESVLCAKKNLMLNATEKSEWQLHAQDHVEENLEAHIVFNLKTSHGVYYANDILVSNCDSTSQALDMLRKVGPTWSPFSGHGSGVVFTN